MKRALILPLIAVIACAGASRANTPNPGQSYTDPCIVTCPLGDSVFTVVGRLFNGQPLVNGDVVLDFSPCPGFHLLEPNLPIQYQVVASAIAIKPTDLSGQADFPLFAGGVCPGTVRVYLSGNLLNSRPVASFDQNGDVGVTDADLAIVSGRIGSIDRTADFNCDGVVTQADYDIATAHLGHIHHTSSLVGVGDGPAIEFGIRATPNPSPGAVEFELRAPEGGPARLAIYDVSGRRLATVLDREIEAGVRHVAWSGRDDTGRAVASGVYRYRFTVGARQTQGALVVAR